MSVIEPAFPFDENVLFVNVYVPVCVLFSYIMSIPSSPSSRVLRHSPNSPSYLESQYKRNLLDEVKSWSENKVSEWLHGQSLGRYGLIFIGQ